MNIKQKDWQLRDPTPLEMRVEALRIQDDASWYPYWNAMQQQYPGNFDSDYEAMCTALGFDAGQAVIGRSPERVHNADTENYHLPLPDGAAPGIECTYGLTWSGVLFQSQVEALNQCIPLEVVLAAGAAVKATVRAIADRP